MNKSATLALGDLAKDDNDTAGGTEEEELQTLVSQVFVPSEQIRKNVLEQVSKLLSTKTYRPSSILKVINLLCDVVSDDKLAYDIQLDICHMLFVITPFSSIRNDRISKLLLSPSMEHLAIPLIAAAGVEGVVTVGENQNNREVSSVIGLDSLISTAELAILASSSVSGTVRPSEKYYLSVLAEVITTILSNIHVVFEGVVLPALGLLSLALDNPWGSRDRQRDTSPIEMSLIASSTEIKTARSLSPLFSNNHQPTTPGAGLLRSGTSEFVDKKGFTSFQTPHNHSKHIQRNHILVSPYTGYESGSSSVTTRLITSQVANGQGPTGMSMSMSSTRHSMSQGSRTAAMSGTNIGTGSRRRGVGAFPSTSLPVLIPTPQALTFAMALGPLLPPSFAGALVSIVTGSMAINNVSSRMALDGSTTNVAETSDRVLMLAIMALRSMGRVSERVLTKLVVTRRSVLCAAAPTADGECHCGSGTTGLDAGGNGVAEERRLIEIGCDDPNVRVAALRGLAAPLWEVAGLPSLVVGVDRSRQALECQYQQQQQQQQQQRERRGILTGVVDNAKPLPPVALPNGCVASDVLEDILRLREIEFGDVRGSCLSSSSSSSTTSTNTNTTATNAAMSTSTSPSASPKRSSDTPRAGSALPLVTVDLVVLLTNIRKTLPTIAERLALDEPVFRNYVVALKELRDCWETEFRDNVVDYFMSGKFRNTEDQDAFVAGILAEAPPSRPRHLQAAPSLTTASPVPFLYSVFLNVLKGETDEPLDMGQTMTATEESAIVAAAFDKVREVRYEALRAFYRRTKLHDVSPQPTSSLTASRIMINSGVGAGYSLFTATADHTKTQSPFHSEVAQGQTQPPSDAPVFTRRLPKLLKDANQDVVIGALRIIDLDPLGFINSLHILQVLFSLFEAAQQREQTSNTPQPHTSTSKNVKIRFLALRVVKALVDGGVNCSKLLETLIKGFITNKLPREPTSEVLARMDACGGVTALIALGTRGIIPPIINKEIPLAQKVLAIEALSGVNPRSAVVTDVVRTIVEVAQPGKRFNPAQQAAAMRTMLRLRNNIIGSLGTRQHPGQSSESLLFSDGGRGITGDSVIKSLPVSFVYLTPEKVADVLYSQMVSPNAMLRNTAAVLLLELGELGEIALCGFAKRLPGNTRLTRITALETLAHRPSLCIPAVISALTDNDIEIQTCAEYIILNIFKPSSVEQAVGQFGATMINEILNSLNVAFESPYRACWEPRVEKFLRYFEKLLMDVRV